MSDIHRDELEPPGFKVHLRLDGRVAALESDMTFVRSDLHEVRTDVRDIRERLGSVEVNLGTLSERVDHVSKSLSDKMDALAEGITGKLDRFPTKLQLSLWACAGLTAVLGVAASIIAVLLRLFGHDGAAAVVDAVSGKQTSG